MTTSNCGLAACVAAVCLAVTQPALAGPGEDPVTITKRVQYLQLPAQDRVASTSIRYSKGGGLPDDTQAKITRYTAQAYVPNPSGISTGKDVVNSVRTNGTQTTCTQAVANTTGGASGDQVVVVTGDLINICN